METLVQSRTERIKTIIVELNDMAEVVSKKIKPPINPEEKEQLKNLFEAGLGIIKAVSALKEAVINLEKVERQKADTPNFW